MDHMDRMHTDNPAWGSRQLKSQLNEMGYTIGRYKVKRFMKEMGIIAIYPKPNLSKPMPGHKIYPYLLRNKPITGPNQAWGIDITYIRLEHGFVYLTAIIDWYSRCIVAWDLDDTLDTTSALNAVKKALEIAKPDILNSDQGSQFTSNKYTEYLKENDVKISMDGKNRWADNIIIERWFRTLKYEEVYLNDYANIRDARNKIGNFINTYNWVRHHSAIGYKSPASLYYGALQQAA
jgi:putative transposase